MRTALPPDLLSRLSEFVVAQTGLYFPPERWGDLERGIAATAPDFDFTDVKSCVNWLLSAPLTRRTNEVLASHLSIGETYFFREKPSLEVFEEQVLPMLLQTRRENGQRHLRLWSAGCCTGEEAYSIAILLDRLIPDLGEWNITILATDFNPKFLKKAALGVYGDWSFRDAPAWLQERYFSKRGDGSFEILPRIKKMVTFSYLNFAEDIYPSLSNNTGAMDVIFCRNVLMYFTAERAKQVAGHFYQALLDGGWFIGSPVEASHSQFPLFTPVEFPKVVLYRKIRETVVPPPVAGPCAFSEAPEIIPLMPSEPAALPPQPVEQQPEPGRSAHQQARCCANRGGLVEALAWCEQAVADDKMNPAHQYLRATILQEQGQYDAAIQSLMRALYLDPDFVLAHFGLGNLHQSQGRYRQAQRYFSNVLMLTRNYPPELDLPESDGLTAGRLAEIVASLLQSLPQPVEANA